MTSKTEATKTMRTKINVGARYVFSIPNKNRDFFRAVEKEQYHRLNILITFILT